MELADEQSLNVGTDWREALLSGFELTCSSLFSLGWLIDRAGHAGWSGSRW